MDWSRRRFLAGLAAGSASVSGCSAVTGRRVDPVLVLAAGSLQNALADGLAPSVSVPVRVETHGSAMAARLVADGKRDPDVLALADVALFEKPLGFDRYSVFATNALAIACADDPGGTTVRNADRWYRPIAEGEASLGRTDPDLDPLGYRTLFALELGEAVYDRPGLADAVLRPDQIYPETALVSQLGTGAIDAAVVYETMASDHGYDAVDLPPALDLSDPGRSDEYARVGYTLPDGTGVTGNSISYGARRMTDRRGARDVFDALVAGEYLPSFGFEVPDEYPLHVEDGSV